MSHTNEILSLINSQPTLTELLQPNNAEQLFEVSSSSISIQNGPARFGTAANIPREEKFDYKPIIAEKPNPTPQANDLLSILKDETQKVAPARDNSINDILVHSHSEIQKLLRSAQRAQQEFLDAVSFD